MRRAHGTAAREGRHLAHLRLDRLGSVAARKSVRNTSDLAAAEKAAEKVFISTQKRKRRGAGEPHLPCETPLSGTCPGRQPELSQ